MALKIAAMSLSGVNIVLNVLAMWIGGGYNFVGITTALVAISVVILIGIDWMKG